MNFYAGITDFEWYSFLARQRPDEVNFWQPGGSAGFRALLPGECFLFKLKSPINAIGGGGFFVRHIKLPLTVAWDTFEQKNGVEDLSTFRRKILSYRRDQELNPEIGCIILAQPFFFDKSQWIPQPASWGKSIVQGKTYLSNDPVGADLWSKVEMRLQMVDAPLVDAAPADTGNDPNRYAERLARIRLGQGGFRALVTENYHRRCSITGEKTLPVLQADHIQPYSAEGPHQVPNGLLLRSDLHTLFDQGYMTVTSEYRVEVSTRIRDEFENGREYYALHGRSIALPDTESEYPRSDYLAWHNANIYKG